MQDKTKNLTRNVLSQRDQLFAFSSVMENIGLYFADQVLDCFNVDYSTSHKNKRNIPAHERVMIVANYTEYPFSSTDHHMLWLASCNFLISDRISNYCLLK